ncbi:hypothetical protein DEO72_LG8g2823 [Vigna unguiculata]|uniref:Secreted protein n=1 Tax=Vigna unguiculata TaxID=3917 RepID=A0A4D6MTM9_VIGUN|nr:hypothetical protein DEO72_LG8g2823 [Vigna unguiculata]
MFFLLQLVFVVSVRVHRSNLAFILCNCSKLLSMLLELLGSLPWVPVLSTSICPGEICYARLSKLLAQTGSSRLSENDSNSPPLVLSARLSEGLSLERDGLA